MVMVYETTILTTVFDMVYGAIFLTIACIMYDGI